MDRRRFLKTGLAGVALSALPHNDMMAASAETAAKAPQMKPAPKQDAFNLGMAGYTFVKFDIDKTLEIMQKLDVHYLCIKNFHLLLESTEEQIQAFHAKLQSKGVTGYAVGPIYMKTKDEVDKAFEYARRVGVRLLVGVPNYELLDYTEQKVKAYDIRLAIHLHGPDMPLYPSATDIWNNVCRRDKRMGMCLDIGHDLRYNQDPLADLKKYASRVFDIHLKDVTGNTKQDHAIELGRGKIDFPRFVRLLRKVGYNGKCSLEYEKDMKDPFLGIAESVGYFRAVCDATR